MAVLRGEPLATGTPCPPSLLAALQRWGTTQPRAPCLTALDTAGKAIHTLTYGKCHQEATRRWVSCKVLHTPRNLDRRLEQRSTRSSDTHSCPVNRASLTAGAPPPTGAFLNNGVYFGLILNFVQTELCSVCFWCLASLCNTVISMSCRNALL